MFLSFLCHLLQYIYKGKNIIPLINTENWEMIKTDIEEE